MSALVLFVCKKNGGKSQMAAALMRQHAGDAITVYSAGTAPGDTLSALAEEAIVEVGASMEGEYPKPIDPEILRSVDRVIVLGDEAKVAPGDGMAGTIETWTFEDQAASDVGGGDRTRAIRDQIAERVLRLASELSAAMS